MAKFSWTLEKIEDCSGNDITTNGWVTVSPTSGDELKDGPKITVTEATKETDCQTATVILSLSNGEKEYINVSRCVPECKCSDVKFTASTTTTASSDASSSFVLGKISVREDCRKYVNISTDGVVLCDATIDYSKTNNNLTAKVNENPYIDSRTGYYKILFKGELCGETHEITQSGIPYPEGCCSANTSSAVTRESTVYEFGANGGEGNIGVFVITGGTCDNENRECWVRTDISSDSNWISIGETTTASTTAPSGQEAKKYTTAITVAKNNSGASGREGVITSTFYNAVRGEFVLKKTTIKQAYVPRCGCEESVMNLVLNSNIPASGFPSTNRIGIISFGGCKPEQSRLSVEKVGSDDWVSLSPLYRYTDDTYYILAVVSKNTTYAKKEATIIAKIDNEECARGVIRQNEPSKPLCDCSNFDEGTGNIIGITGVTDIDGTEQEEVQIAIFSVKYKAVGNIQEAGTCDVDKIDCIPLCGNVWVKDVRTEITVTTTDNQGYTYKKGKITAHILENDTGADRSCQLGLFINSGYTSEPCTRGTGTIVQKKKPDEPTYTILIMLNITNTKYGGVHYSGNKYGFAMDYIDFTLTNDETFRVIVSNMLICGEVTRQYVPISSRYISTEQEKKYFKKIVINGVKYPSGGGKGDINTDCENCSKIDVDEEAIFNITML